MIKMDIKGATQRALSGGRQTLGRGKRPRLAISTEESADNPKEIAFFVESLRLGYQVACGDCAVSSYTVRPTVLLFQ